MNTLLDKLASALSVSPCRCLRDYDMKVVQQCSRCSSLDEYSLHLAAQQSLREAGEGMK